MSKTNQISKETAEIADLFEQIKSVNEMIETHRKSDSDFMSEQYTFRKSKLMKELKSLLAKYEVYPQDLAA